MCRYAGTFLVSTLCLGLLYCAVPDMAVGSMTSATNQPVSLRLTSTDEQWPQQWRFSNSMTRLPDGNSAGYYRRPPATGQASPGSERSGMVILYPLNRNTPVTISRSGVELSTPASRLLLGVAANRNPSGSWQLTIKINGRQLIRQVTIQGRGSWQDLEFDLSSYDQQQLTIEIEAWSTGRSNEFVFIDYIKIEPPPGTAADATSYQQQQPLTYFDAAYQRFLELHWRREQERMQRLRDQEYMDQ